MMKAESTPVRIFVFAILAFSLPSVLKAVDARKIAVVQNKDILESSDFQVIDTFVEEAVREITETKDFTAISKVRDDFVVNSVSKKDSSKAQYRNQFTKSATEHITQAFKTSQALPPDTRFRVVINLMILIETLRDIQLSTLVLDKLNDNNAAINYWAIKCFANPEVIKQLDDAGEDSPLAAQIFTPLGKTVENCDDTRLILITNLAADIKGQQATDLLIRIADLRIKQYAQWQVKDEITDTVILKSLFSKIVSNQGGADIARRFAQLYAYVVQRYTRNETSDLHKQKLVTVMAEVEDKCIRKLLGKQTKIRESIEKKDNAALLTEHDNLLGSANTEGQLCVKLNFIYKTADGKESTTPLVLPQAGQ
jgi:hypothetical protein